MKFLSLLLLLGFLSSCGSQKVIPLKNKVEQTKKLRVSVGMDEEFITDNDPSFESIKDFVSGQEPQWGQPLGTFPTPQITVAFLDSSDNLLFPLWIGPNWIGTRYKNDSYLKNLPESEIDSLRIMLGK